MKNAALNTVMGLGTVFVILIMLIFLISLFQFIPGSGAQEAKAKKKAAEDAAAAPTPAPVAAAPVQEADNSRTDCRDRSSYRSIRRNFNRRICCSFHPQNQPQKNGN